MNTNHYTTQSLGGPIFTPRSVRRVAVGRADSLMSYGDRMSVRVTIDGQPAMQYETCQAADMTDLIADLRRRTRGMRGLATVYVRNHDRGWARERHIMLYPQKRQAPAQRPKAVQVPMFFPWDF